MNATKLTTWRESWGKRKTCPKRKGDERLEDQQTSSSKSLDASPTIREKLTLFGQEVRRRKQSCEVEVQYAKTPRHGYSNPRNGWGDHWLPLLLFSLFLQFCPIIVWLLDLWIYSQITPFNIGIQTLHRFRHDAKNVVIPTLLYLSVFELGPADPRPFHLGHSWDAKYWCTLSFWQTSIISLHFRLACSVLVAFHGDQQPPKIGKWNALISRILHSGLWSRNWEDGNSGKPSRGGT